MFKVNDRRPDDREPDRVAGDEGWRPPQRAHEMGPAERVERQTPMASVAAHDEQVREEIRHITPEGAPPDMKARHDSAVLLYCLLGAAVVVALSVMAWVGGWSLAAAAIAIFPACFLIAVMPVWNATRMRMHDRAQAEVEVIRREGVGPLDEHGKPAPKVRPLDG
jgi:hypothetical protein